MHELKTHRGVMCNDSEKCVIFYGFWHKKFDKLWLEQVETLKNLHFNGLLLTKVHIVCTEEFSLMTLESDAKFEVELTCQFKIDMKNLTNFDSSTRISQTLALGCAGFDQSI